MTSPKKRVPKKHRTKTPVQSRYVDNYDHDYDYDNVIWEANLPPSHTMHSVAFEGDVGPLVHTTLAFFSNRPATHYAMYGNDDDEIETFVPLPESPTWHDLRIATNYAMRASGDLHHRFIESFEKHDGYIKVYLGS